MRALVEFLMRGRANACFLALLGCRLPFFSTSIIGLVTLRKGYVEGSVVALWALLPSLLIWFASDKFAIWYASNQGGFEAARLITFIESFALVIAIITAQILRVSISWQWSLVALVIISFGGILCASTYFPRGIEELVTYVIQIHSIDSQLSLDLEKNPSRFYLGLNFWLVLVGVVSLIISRWWQALSVNPGGFQKEFHGFRLDAPVARVIMGFGMIGFFLYSEYAYWFLIALTPLLLSGVALAHHSAAALKLNTSFLVLMYIGLLMFSPAFALILICLGFVDSQFDLRFKLADMKDRES